MWPDLIQKAKDGGLDVIQTYVFWNGHEPSPGKVHTYASSIFPPIIYFTFLLSDSISELQIFLFFSTVLLWGSIRFSEVHQGCTSSRTLCSSPNRTLCLRWMEFWVNSSSFLKYLNNVYPSESFFIFWILLFCFQFGVLLKISFFWLIMLQWFPCLAQICTWYGVQDRQSTI